VRIDRLASRTAFFAALFLAAAQLPLHASDDACKADSARLCPDLQFGSPAAWRCLRQNRGEASRDCQILLNQRRELLLERIHDACGSDMARFCSEHRSGGDGLIRCLRRHQSQLTETCKATLPREPD
jgi:hypothetical protein